MCNQLKVTSYSHERKKMESILTTNFISNYVDWKSENDMHIFSFTIFKK